MSGWHDVLDQQLDLYRFWKSEIGEMAAAGFAESMTQVAREVGGDDQVRAEAPFTASLRDIEILKCAACDPIYVAEEMMDLVEVAAETFQPEPLEATDMVTRAGFLVLPRPLFMPDRHNLRVGFRIISWYPVAHAQQEEMVRHAEQGDAQQNGVHLSLYSHCDDTDDFPEHTELAVEFARSARTPYSLAHVTGWDFGADVPSEEAATGGWWGPVQALFRLMMQTVSERESTLAPRAARKRWTREGTRSAPSVTVVRLRRPRSHNDNAEHHSIEWTRRWLVSGHWRNQWFPSLKLHRQVWISPYVKGPENQPLVVRKAHAYEFVK